MSEPAPRPPFGYLDVVARVAARPPLSGVLPDDSGYRSPYLPTRRFGFDALASFFAPARFRPRTPTEVGAATAWTVLDARTGRLALFAGPAYAANLGTVTAFVRPVSTRSLADDDVAIAAFHATLDREAPAFFAGRPPIDADRARGAIGDAFAPGELAALREAAPDFFGWLDV